MASISLGITSALQGGAFGLDTTEATEAAPSQIVYHVPPASQAPAPASNGAQQDTVTLSGAAPPNGDGGQRFVLLAAFTLLSQEITFPPETAANGASVPADGEASSDAAPAAATDQEAASAAAQEPANANAIAVAAAAGGALPAGNAGIANAASRAADTGVATSGDSLTAPQETLQQLDQELQRLGINPLDISLMNRMGLLLWVNDPAALQQFVQALRSPGSPEQSQAAASPPTALTGGTQDTTVGAANQTDGSVAAKPDVGAQGQSAGATQNQSQAVVLGSSNSARVAETGEAAGGTASSSNPPLRQNSVAVLQQFQELQVSLAAAGQDAQTAFSNSPSSTVPGQQLNISA
ncbi:MAG: hypothetical protein WA211_13875 [Candidatus Acidiferrales bacterium]